MAWAFAFTITNCEGHSNLMPHKTKYITQYAHHEMGKKLNKTYMVKKAIKWMFNITSNGNLQYKGKSWAITAPNGSCEMLLKSCNLLM